MALADFTPERVEVKYKGKALATVRGLNLEDLSVLIRSHLGDLQRLWELLEDDKQNVFQRLSADGFLLKLIGDAPVLGSKIIAIASDEPEAAEQAKLLPLPLQVMFLQHIVRLTFEDIGGPKAFVALIKDMIGK